MPVVVAMGFETGGVFEPARSRLQPIKKSPPSRRQFLAIAENCSLCHLMVTIDPKANGRFRRTQAPDWDVSSSVANARQDVPLASHQETSATAHKMTRGSISRPSMPDVSANRDRSLVTTGLLRIFVPARVGPDPLVRARFCSDALVFVCRTDQKLRLYTIQLLCFSITLAYVVSANSGKYCR